VTVTGSGTANGSSVAVTLTVATPEADSGTSLTCTYDVVGTLS
jgi:hypothetical protein